jgi:hypothetical protein
VERRANQVDTRWSHLQNADPDPVAAGLQRSGTFIDKTPLLSKILASTPFPGTSPHQTTIHHYTA